MDPITTDRLEPAASERYHADGYLVVRGLLDPARAEDIARDVLAVLRARNMDDTCLSQTHEYLAGSPIDALVNSSRLRHLVAAVLGGPSSVYMPFTAVKGPGQGAFLFHQDNQYTRLDAPACNVWFALRATGPHNGGLRVVPGSHRQGLLPSQAMFADGSHNTVVEQPTEWEEVALDAGDCVLFDRLTLHASGGNPSDEHRVAYAVQFHRDDARRLDPETGAWLSVREHPRVSTGPVAALSRA